MFYKSCYSIETLKTMSSPSFCSGTVKQEEHFASGNVFAHLTIPDQKEGLGTNETSMENNLRLQLVFI